MDPLPNNDILNDHAVLKHDLVSLPILQFLEAEKVYYEIVAKFSQFGVLSNSCPNLLWKLNKVYGCLVLLVPPLCSPPSLSSVNPNCQSCHYRTNSNVSCSHWLMVIVNYNPTVKIATSDSIFIGW